MRPSTTSTRASHAPGSQALPSATLLARLADKKKEIEAVEALERASALFLRRLEGLADDCEAMADAGIVHGQVLAQWPQMFRILMLFAAAREASSAAREASSATITGDDGAGVDTDTDVRPGGRLVRVPIDELQADIK